MPDNEYSTLLFDVRNNIGYITLNRPEAGNALNAELAHDLMEVSLRCDEDDILESAEWLRFSGPDSRRQHPCFQVCAQDTHRYLTALVWWMLKE